MNSLTSPAQSTRQLLSGIKVVDADTHISEWYDLWTSRAPARWKARVPQVKQIDGSVAWIIDGVDMLNRIGATSAVRKDGSKAAGMSFRDVQLDDAHPGAYNVKARLQYMDEQGIAAQIAYPNLLGFGGQKAMTLDPELRLVCTQIFNDAMFELQEESNHRIYPMAMVPWWDVKLAVVEAARCHKMGARGINMNSDPHLHGLPHLGNAYWNPLWELCVERDMPVHFHIGASDESSSWYGSGLWPGAPFDNEDIQLVYGSVMVITSNLRVLANILLSGFLENFPTLKIVSVESGIGWVPFLLEALEYQLAEAGKQHRHSPREVFQRQMYACSWFERRSFAQTARTVGIDNVMFETDFPHPTCLYPNGLDYVAGAIADLTVEERRKVFGGTAARIYNLDLNAVPPN